VTVSVTKTVAVLAVVGTAAGENGNGGSAHVVPAGRIAVVLATGIYCLDDGLRVRTIIGLDGCCWGGGQNSRRECEGVKISTFGYGSVLEDDQEAGIVSPFDLEPSTDAFPLGECDLDVLCLELLGKASQGQNAGYGCRETRGGSRSHVFGKCKGGTMRGYRERVE